MNGLYITSGEDAAGLLYLHDLQLGKSNEVMAVLDDFSFGITIRKLVNVGLHY